MTTRKEITTHMRATKCNTPEPLRRVLGGL